MISIDSANEGTDRTAYLVDGVPAIVTTRQQMVDAFNQWNRDYKADPQSFTDCSNAGEEYGNACADKLIKYIESQSE